MRSEAGSWRGEGQQENSSLATPSLAGDDAFRRERLRLRSRRWVSEVRQQCGRGGTGSGGGEGEARLEEEVWRDGEFGGLRTGGAGTRGERKRGRGCAAPDLSGRIRDNEAARKASPDHHIPLVCHSSNQVAVKGLVEGARAVAKAKVGKEDMMRVHRNRWLRLALFFTHARAI